MGLVAKDLPRKAAPRSSSSAKKDLNALRTPPEDFQSIRKKGQLGRASLPPALELSASSATCLWTKYGPQRGIS